MDASTWVASLVSAALVVVHITVCVVALGVIPGGRKPSTCRAWQRQVDELVSAEIRYDPAAQTAPAGPSVGAVRLNERLGSLPLTGDNRIEVHPDYAHRRDDQMARGAEQAVDHQRRHGRVEAHDRWHAGDGGVRQ